MSKRTGGSTPSQRSAAARDVLPRHIGSRRGRRADVHAPFVSSLGAERLESSAHADTNALNQRATSARCPERPRARRRCSHRWVP